MNLQDREQSLLTSLGLKNYCDLFLFLNWRKYPLVIVTRQMGISTYLSGVVGKIAF